MKIVIDIPETAYEAYKEWNKNMVATVEQSLIANGTPYEDRPQGEWKLDSLGAYCSECKKYPDYTTDFCPFCGAKMTKEAENE